MPAQKREPWDSSPVFAAAWMLLLCLAGCGGDPLENRGDKAYNVLLISVDTLRADHVGAYGYGEVKTPNMDRLAAEGALFMHAYTPCPITLPAHVSLMTGLNPVSHGVRNNGIARAAPDLNTLAEALQGQGYSTGAVIGAFVLDSGYGLDQGFDEYDDAILYGDEKSASFFYPERIAGDVTQQACAFLRRQGEAPFFLWVHYFDPHNIYQPPQPYAAQYADHPYDGEIAYVDEQIGVLRKMLELTRRDEDTLIVLCSDHGESLGEHGEKTHGVFVYDATLHVPLILHNAELIADPQVLEAPVSLLDVMPTVLDILHITPAGKMEGASLVPLMRGLADKVHDRIFFESLMSYFDFGWAGLRGFRTDKVKYIAAPRPEIYHVETDPGELDNIHGREEKTAASLHASLLQWEARISQAIRASRSGAGQAADRDAMDKLAALGYSSGALHTSIEGNPFEGPDPKDRIWLTEAMHEATEMFYGGQYREAVDKLEKLHAAEPENTDLLVCLGALNKDMGRLDEAARYNCMLLEIQPDNARAHNNLGVIYDRQGRKGEAKEQFQKTLELDPKHMDALYNLALIHTDQEEWGQAEACLLRALELQPHFSKAHNNLGALHASQGKYEASIRSFEEAISLDPGFGKAHYNCAKSYYQLQDFQKAAIHLKQARQLDEPVDPQFEKALKARMDG